VVVSRYEVWLIALDPTVGREIKKSRPCLVVSPDEMNQSIGTFIIASMSTKRHDLPSRVETSFDGKRGWILLDQIRTVDRARMLKRLGKIGPSTINEVKMALKEMLVD